MLYVGLRILVSLIRCTWSECSENVWTHCLVAISQTLTVRSEEPETKCSLSGEKATHSTQLVWPDSVAIRLP